MRILSADPLNAETPMEDLRADITRSSRLFVRSHFSRPRLDSRRHVVAVGGAVRRELKLTLGELEGMEVRTVAVTLECAGNGRTRLRPVPSGEPWGLGAVGTARWTGVPLRVVLQSAGLKPEAREVLAIGSDSGRPPDQTREIPFARSLPSTKALDPDTLLALRMNDKPIPPEHGGPIRLIVPGWYGMASVKWLARIEGLVEPFRGYYQVNRYVYESAEGTDVTPVRTIRVRSLIVSPSDGEAVPRGEVIVRGRAWSGDGDIVSVQVAVDGVRLPGRAHLGSPLSAHSWRPWECAWDARSPGRHVIQSRAADAKGNHQPEAGAWNRHGYGNNSAQTIDVTVR